MTRSVLYLHGFASSPGSRKAQAFGARFASYDVHYDIPDLNQPTFETLTLTAILETVAQTVASLPPGPVALIGSSFGGLSAVHFMDRYKGREADRVDHVILLAPALDFMSNRQRELGDDQLAQWRDSGQRMVYHFATQTERPLHYGIVNDIRLYDSYAATVNVPTLIFHGKHDESVDYTQSVRFAENRANVDLRLLDSDHALTDAVDTIWRGMLAFLKLKFASRR